MRLQSRLKKLDAVMPRCQQGITRIVINAEPTEADRGLWCGGCHTRYIQEVIVETREDSADVARQECRTSERINSRLRAAKQVEQRLFQATLDLNGFARIE